MRAARVLPALAVILAGCLAGEPTPPAAAGLPTVAGLVLDRLLLPLAGAEVTLLETNTSVVTGADGRFRFAAVEGLSALVHARADGHEGATRRASLDGGDAYLEIVLAPLPLEAPYQVAMEHGGFVSCGAMVRLGGEGERGQVITCGQDDPNDQRELEFEVPVAAGIQGAVLELAWDPASPLAARFAFSLSVVDAEGERQLGRAEGERYVKLSVPREVARELLVNATLLRTRAEPAPSMLDEEAFAGAGAAVAQPFTVVATLFYHAPAPPGYRALD